MPIPRASDATPPAALQPDLHRIQAGNVIEPLVRSEILDAVAPVPFRLDRMHLFDLTPRYAMAPDAGPEAPDDFGVRDIDMPASPLRVWAAINGGTGGGQPSAGAALRPTGSGTSANPSTTGGNQ